MGKYPARWRAACIGNPHIEAEMVATRTEFGKRLIGLKHRNEEPSGLDLLNLELCGNFALDRSCLFWGSDEHPEHLHLKNLVREGLEWVEQRIRENEELRAAQLQRVRADRDSATLSPAPPGPRPEKPKEPTAAPKRARAKKTKAEAYAGWERETYPNGVPAGTSDKDLVREYFEAKGISISPDTIRRATGRK